MTDIQKAIADLERGKENLERTRHIWEGAEISNESQYAPAEFYYNGVIFGVQLALDTLYSYSNAQED